MEPGSAAAGAVAAYCLEHKLQPRQVREKKHRADFQTMLVDTLGFQLSWLDHLRLQSRVKHDPLGI